VAKLKALVTGATGFTGGYLVENLLRHNYKVRILAQPTSNIDKFKNKPVEIFLGRLQTKEHIFKAVEGVDVVFHVAALYRSANLPDTAYWEVNVIGTQNLLDAALYHNVKRFVHCSTGGVHGHIKNPPANEEAPFRPGDVYQDSKAEAEKLSLFYFSEKGLPVSVVRPTGIYGPGDTRMLKMYRMIQNKKFIMFGKGTVNYHLTFVTDTVEGLRLAAEKEAAIGQAFLIAGEEYTTLSEFAQAVAKILNVPIPKIKLPVWPLYWAGFFCEKICVPFKIQPPIFRRRVDIFTKDRAFDISKAKRDLGFKPVVSMEDGLLQTAKWYIQNGYLRDTISL
jgi:nucleoside-diphosphate-sugar epimerase